MIRFIVSRKGVSVKAMADDGFVCGFHFIPFIHVARVQVQPIPDDENGFCLDGAYEVAFYNVLGDKPTTFYIGKDEMDLVKLEDMYDAIIFAMEAPILTKEITFTF